METTPDNPPEPSRFDPETFEFDWEKVTGREFEWDPGRRVRIYRPPLSKGAKITIFLIVTILVGALGSLFAGVAIDPSRIPMACLFVAPA